MAIEFGSRRETFENFKVYETMLAGRPFKVEMGKMCGLSNASAMIRYGETCVLGKEIGDDALFTVGLQNYHFKNIESFFNISYETICKLQKPRSVATSCQDILMEYFREHEMLDAAVDGRMTILPSTAQTG